jgi:hypothetical protein
MGRQLHTLQVSCPVMVQVWVSVSMVMSGWGTAVNSYTVGRSPVWQLVLDGFFIVNGLRIMVARRRHGRRWA